MQEVRICPFCPTILKDIGIPRAACNEHLENFMFVKRQIMKPVDYQSAYYRQKRRFDRIPMNSDGTMFPCKYCGEEFPRQGIEVFHPGSRCREKWLLENPMSMDYSVITKEEIEKLYYEDNLSLKSIAKWYQENRNLSISSDSIRKILIKYGISWELKVQRQSLIAKKG
jgi:hypothetical protein